MFRVGYLRVRGASRDLRACRAASRASRPCGRHTPREVIAFAAERLMEIEVGALAGAAHGEKSPARLVQICQNCCLTGSFQSIQNRFAFKFFNGGRKTFGQPAQSSQRRYGAASGPHEGGIR